MIRIYPLLKVYIPDKKVKLLGSGETGRESPSDPNAISNRMDIGESAGKDAGVF